MTSQVIELTKPLFQNISLDKTNGNDASLIYYNGQLIEVDPHQAWFWTSEWQEGEQKVEDYILRGEIEEFDSMEGFLETLFD